MHKNVVCLLVVAVCTCHRSLVVNAQTVRTVLTSLSLLVVIIVIDGFYAAYRFPQSPNK